MKMKLKTIYLIINETDNLWFTSDLHLGHKLLSGLRGFKDIQTHDKVIIERFNSKVKPNETVFLLGDITLKGSKEWVNYLNKMNGIKYLVVGNHDRSIPPSKFILVSPLMNLTVTQGIVIQQRITLCHYPMVSWYQSQRGAWQLFGHEHCNLSYACLERYQMDVGVDCHNLYPISFKQLYNSFNT